MPSRLDELLTGFFYDELSEEEEGELATLVESNSMAAEKLEQVKADKLEAANAPPLEEPKTSLRLRLMASALLLVILFGFIGMFWIEFEDNLLRSIDGQVLRDGEAINALTKPADVEIERQTSFEVRGSTKVSTAQASLKVGERWPNAEITIKSGVLMLERTRDKKGLAIFLCQDLELHLLERASKARFGVTSDGLLLEELEKSALLKNLSKDELALSLEGKAVSLSPGFEGELKLVDSILHLSVSKGSMTSGEAPDHATFGEGEHTPFESEED